MSPQSRERRKLKLVDSTPGAGPAAVRQRGARRPGTLLGIAVAALLCVAALALVLAAGQPGSAGPAPRPARPFTLPELGSPGQRVSLAAYAGRPVLINFFASWCAPCKRETPVLASFYRAHHGELAVIGVDSNDESGAALRFLRSRGVTYPVAYDAFPAPVAASYGIITLPQTFVLNSKHQIVRHITGDVSASQLTAWAASMAGPG